MFSGDSQDALLKAIPLIAVSVGLSFSLLLVLLGCGLLKKLFNRKASENHAEEEGGENIRKINAEPQPVSTEAVSPELTVVPTRTIVDNGVTHSHPGSTTLSTDIPGDVSSSLYEEVDINTLRLQNSAQTDRSNPQPAAGHPHAATHDNVTRKTSADCPSKDIGGGALTRPLPTMQTSVSANPILPPRNTESVFIGAHTSGGAAGGIQPGGATSPPISGGSLSSENAGRVPDYSRVNVREPLRPINPAFPFESTYEEIKTDDAAPSAGDNDTASETYAVIPEDTVIRRNELRKMNSTDEGLGRPPDNPRHNINRTSAPGTLFHLVPLHVNNEALDDPGYSAIKHPDPGYSAIKHPDPGYSAINHNLMTASSVNETETRQRSSASSDKRPSMPVYAAVQKDRKTTNVERLSTNKRTSGEQTNEGEIGAGSQSNSDGREQDNWPVYTPVKKSRDETSEKESRTSGGGGEGAEREESTVVDSDEIGGQPYLYTEVSKPTRSTNGGGRSPTATTTTPPSVINAPASGAGRVNASAVGNVRRRVAPGDGGYASIVDEDVPDPRPVDPAAARSRHTYDSIIFPRTGVETVTSASPGVRSSGIGPGATTEGNREGELLSNRNTQNIYENPDDL